jgi:DNA-binding PadR family transcriptional regulator
MHFRHHNHCRDKDRWAGGRDGHRGHRRHGGWGGRHGRGMGDDDMMRGRRMLVQGDLRLIALALIAEQPRHGYDIIKALEEKTADWYSPSPGIVYPTLTYLEEVGYLTAQSEGAKKLYTITEEGRAHLEENRGLVDAVMKRFEFIGERAQRIRERMGDDDARRNLPQLVRAAIDNLRDVAAKRLDADPDAEEKIVEALARVAGELRRGN